MISRALFTALLALALAAPVHAATTMAAPQLGDLSKVGSVSFPTSCDPAVQKDFERGLALLHSFFYDEARRVFETVAARDPDCAMAHWGVAMTHYHPLWTPPDSVEFAAGRAAAHRAIAARRQNEREEMWVRAVAAYYDAAAKPANAEGAPSAPAMVSCHGGGADPAGRPARFRDAMRKVQAGYPDDPEAAAFYALSVLGTAKPGDPTLANPRQAAAILEPWYAKHPNHPGLAHYLIHSYDYPPLAKQGLPAANAYAAMQPWVPHALHMPSHIYTRLGMWKETVASNAASASAAKSYGDRYFSGATTHEELHALDYMMYGYLQTAQDAKAKETLERAGRVTKTHPAVDFAVGYALGAMPARFALERRQWKEAAALDITSLPFWSKLPFAEGHIAYARAVGAARAGDLEAAARAGARLQELSARSTDPRFRYFADQMELQRQAALGLIAFARGEKEEALRMLRVAAAREDSLGKHPVSPGAILPIRELLAETLAETGRHADALAEFEATLALHPRRFNAIAGAAATARQAGRADLARRYSAELLELAKDGDGARPELKAAKEATTLGAR